MMFVGHRMEEIYRVADRVTVLRDGRLVATGADRRDAARPGRQPDGRPRRSATCTRARAPRPATSVLEVDGPVAATARSPTSRSRCGPARSWASPGWSAAAAPRSPACCSASTGRPPARSQLDGHEVAFASPGDAMAHGIAYVSEDRIGQSLVMDFSILANASLPVIDQATAAGLIRPARELGLVQRAISTGCGCASAATTSRSRRCPAATSRRSCSSKWLATKPRAADPGRADPGHRRADQGRGPRGHRRPRPAGPGHHPDLVRAARAARACATGSWCCARAGSPPSCRAAEATQERVLYAMTDAGGDAASRPAEHAARRDPRSSAAAARAGCAGSPRTRELGLLLAMAAVDRAGGRWSTRAC